MHKVVLISGSPKAQGNTAQVMEKCADRLKEMGLQPDVIKLAGKKIEGCLGCRKCVGKGVCVINDDLNDIADRVRAAKGFIVGSPVYFGTARGDLMNLLQRLGMVSYGNDRFLSWKVGGPVAVARRGGATASIQEMLMFFFINDMIVPGSHYWNMLFGKQPGEALQDEEGMATVLRFAENVGNLVLKLY